MSDRRNQVRGLLRLDRVAHVVSRSIADLDFVGRRFGFSAGRWEFPIEALKRWLVEFLRCLRAKGLSDSLGGIIARCH